MNEKTREELANEIFEQLKEKHLLESDAITVLRDVISKINEVRSNHILH